ncbi:DUF1211 domain-containing protein [Erwinia sp. CPCC 100877]|nr:DUF1211 domain-containing protein [Erwinia sp. CPCC 100877]
MGSGSMDKNKKNIQIDMLQNEAKEKYLDSLPHHLQVLNDAIIAIILTLMALEIPLPNGSRESFFSFIKAVGIFFISFFIVSNFWYEHHKTMSLVRKANKLILVMNFLFMAILSLIPILTKWIMLAPMNNLAILNFGICYFLINLIQLCMHRLVYTELLNKNSIAIKNVLRIVNIRVFLIFLINILLILLSNVFPTMVMICYLSLPCLSLLWPNK